MRGEREGGTDREMLISLKALPPAWASAYLDSFFHCQTCQTQPSSPLSICPSLSLTAPPPHPPHSTQIQQKSPNLASKSPFKTSLIKQQQKSFHINDGVSGEGLFMNNTNYHLSLSVIFAWGYEGHVLFDIKQNAHNLPLPSFSAHLMQASPPSPFFLSFSLLSVFLPLLLFARSRLK